MLTFDIPINIKVSADTEEQAENIVTHMMKKNMDTPALLRQVLEWDFFFFSFEDEFDHATNLPSV